MNSISGNSVSGTSVCGNSLSGNSLGSISSRPYLQHARYVIVNVHQRHKEKMAKVDCIVDTHLGWGAQRGIHALCIGRKRVKAEAILSQKNSALQQRLDEMPSRYETGGQKLVKSKFSGSKTYGLIQTNRLPPVSAGQGSLMYDSSEINASRGEISSSDSYRRSTFSGVGIRYGSSSSLSLPSTGENTTSTTPTQTVLSLFIFRHFDCNE